MVVSTLELVVYKVSFTLVLLLILTRNKRFKDILQKKEYTKSDLNKIGVVFGLLAIIASICIINVYGAISITRNIVIVSATLLFGRRAGIIALVITLIHRLSINIYTVSLEMEIIQLVLITGLAIIVQPKVKEDKMVITSILISTITLFFMLVYVLIFKNNDAEILKFAKDFAMPILISQLGVGLFISILQDIQNERIRIEQEKEIEKLKTNIAKAELKALQNQINPHFLFNTLNAISILTKKDPNKARRLIIKLSSYLRYNLNLKTGLISIQKEIEQTKVYLEIEQVRYKDKLDIIYDIDETIDIKIPSLIIQPIVENAIIHGILKSKEKGKLIISVKKIKDYVRVMVENKGVPIDEEVIEHIKNEDIDKNKIGLYNVHCRLNYQYNRGLEITRLEDGTRVEFRIGGATK